MMTATHTTIAAAVDCLERDDRLAIREEIALGNLDAIATVTDTDNNQLTIVGEYNARPMTVAASLAELDELYL